MTVQTFIKYYDHVREWANLLSKEERQGVSVFTLTLVHGVITSYSENWGVSWASVQTLADRAGLSYRQLLRARDVLVEWGWYNLHTRRPKQGQEQETTLLTPDNAPFPVAMNRYLKALSGERPSPEYKVSIPIPIKVRTMMLERSDTLAEGEVEGVCQDGSHPVTGWQSPYDTLAEKEITNRSINTSDDDVLELHIQETPTGLSNGKIEAYNLLIEEGLSKNQATKFAKQHQVEHIKEWIKAIQTLPNIQNPPAYLYSALAQDLPIPELQTSGDRQRYAEQLNRAFTEEWTFSPEETKEIEAKMKAQDLPSDQGVF